jgi:hypothetical protein
MKRIFSLVLVTTISLLAFVGCNADEAPDARIDQPVIPDAAPMSDAS